MTVTDVKSTVTELTVDQARRMFDERCRQELGVSAEEFLAAIKAKEVPADWPADAVSRLEILLPFAR